MSVMIFDKDDQPVEAEFIGFAGGERHVQLDPARIQKIETPRTLTIRAHLASSDDVMDLFLLADAIIRIDDAACLRLELPYLPYARQDRVCAPGQAFSLNVFARLLRCLPNVTEIVTWDCHSPEGLAQLGAASISASDIILTCPALVDLLADDRSVLISPDKGGVPRTRAIAAAVGQPTVLLASKIRDPRTGMISHTEVEPADLTGRTAIITDDICDGGFTFTLLAAALRERGAARVILFVTHGIFSRGLNVFDGLIDEIYTTDSRLPPNDPRLHVIPFQHAF